MIVSLKKNRRQGRKAFIHSLQGTHDVWEGTGGMEEFSSVNCKDLYLDRAKTAQGGNWLLDTLNLVAWLGQGISQTETAGKLVSSAYVLATG